MKIQTIQGKWDDTCTISNNLTENGMTQDFIRDVIEYSEPRMLSTLLAAGASNMWDARIKDTDAIKSQIHDVATRPMTEIGNSAYRYKVMGRIQDTSTVLSQVGVTQPDGSFFLKMGDSKLYPGQMVKFYRDGFYASVVGQPNVTSGGFVYQFRNPLEQFNATVHLHPTGDKLAFGAYTAYSQGSLRSYSRSFYPSEFINHMTIQRKTLAITGSALTDVVKLKAMGMSGWFYQKEQQARAQFRLEAEHQRWFGPSSMRDANFNLLAKPFEVDPETGHEIIRGDGVLPQIEGGNDFYGSGADGNWTIDDLNDMMNTLGKHSDEDYGNVWYVITGTDGYTNAQTVLANTAKATYNFVMNVDTSTSTGGPNVGVGGNFATYHYAGNTLIFIKHQLWDDPRRWFERGSDGKLNQSGMALFLNPKTINGSNLEILTKGAYGINRSFVSAYIDGLTGRTNKPLSSVDAVSFEMLREDMICLYNTQTCGVIRKSNF